MRIAHCSARIYACFVSPAKLPDPYQQIYMIKLWRDLLARTTVYLFKSPSGKKSRVNDNVLIRVQQNPSVSEGTFTRRLILSHYWTALVSAYYCCRKAAVCIGDQLLDFLYRNSFGANQRLALAWKSFRIVQVNCEYRIK